MIQGLKRAAFSNEAGIGSAAIAHSAVRTNEPLTEGYVALLEPFIDTVVICTMTALVIVITGAYATEGNDRCRLNLGRLPVRVSLVWRCFRYCRACCLPFPP
jgi:Na+/alanine symporter